MSIKVETFFDKTTFTLTYLVYDEKSKDAILIDPVLNYDLAASVITFDSINNYLDFVSVHNLKLHYVLETHAHADHLTGAAEIKKLVPSTMVGINKNITKVQKVFANVLNNTEINTDGKQFDILLDEETLIHAGTIELKTIFTPGHTPACSSFLINDMLFCGDALFFPDSGTGRCDFPEGSADDLYDSVINKIYTLPDETKIFVGHDYQPNGRNLESQTTVAKCKKENIQLKADTSRNEFIKFRSERDETLNAPRLLLPSIQVNIDAGKLPIAEENGTRFLKLPLTIKE